MKLILPADLPVVFFPTPGDDKRETFPKLDFVTELDDKRGNAIKALTDGRNVEFHHSNGSKAIISINDILIEVVKATFYQVYPEMGEPR